MQENVVKNQNRCLLRNNSDNSEEDIDLYKDTGKETKEQGTESPSSASMDETNWTVQEIVHSRAFWVFTLSDLIIAGTGMLLDRNVTDACTIAQHIRTRHNGLTASPWNEPECNQLYSRAMAHFNIFDQACDNIRTKKIKAKLPSDRIESKGKRFYCEIFKCIDSERKS